jgi:hypothetical protein
LTAAVDCCCRRCRCCRPPPLASVTAAVVVSPPPPFFKPRPPLSLSCRSPMTMEGVSPPWSAPPPVPANNEDNGNIAIAFGVVVNAPGSRTQGPTTVNNKDNKESNVSINKSDRLHNAKEVAPMRIRTVVSCAAKSSLLAYFHRVIWPLNNFL